MEKAKQSGCVLVAEAARPNGDLISARKGNAKYRITFHGKASHAGSALTEGISAITELAHWVLAINEQVNMTTGTTMNVGVVQGGTGVNVVPDFAEAIVDLRFWSNEEAAAVHDRLTFMANNPFLAGCRVEVDRQTFKPAMRPSGDTEAVMALVEAAAKEEGIPFNWLEAGGGSDANFTAAAGGAIAGWFRPHGRRFPLGGGIPAAGQHRAAHPPAAAGAGQAGEISRFIPCSGHHGPLKIGPLHSKREAVASLFFISIFRASLNERARWLEAVTPVAQPDRPDDPAVLPASHRGAAGRQSPGRQSPWCGTPPCSPQASKPSRSASCCSSQRVAASRVRPVHSGGQYPGIDAGEVGDDATRQHIRQQGLTRLLPERGVDGKPQRVAAFSDPVWCAPHAVDIAGHYPVEVPLLLQVAQRRLIALLERRFDGEQQMGQLEGFRLKTHQRQRMSEKSGFWWRKGGQCHHLMARLASMTEGQHGIFATAPEQDDARHG